MKRIVMFLILFLFVLLGVSLIVSYNKTTEKNYVYYSIPKNYALYDDGKRSMSVDVYTEENNSIISFVDKNVYQIKINNNEYRVYDIKVTKRKDIYENKSIYVYTFNFNIKSIPLEVKKEACELLIISDDFQLNVKIGILSIYRGDYEILDFLDLYGNYSYIDGELHLVGITIAFGKGYYNLTNIESGISYGRLDKIEKDTMLGSEITIDEVDKGFINSNILDYNYDLNNKNRYYFIPLGYEKLLLNLNPCFIFEIDGKEYLLDNFYYLINDISLSNYIKSKKAGEIIYA